MKIYINGISYEISNFIAERISHEYLIQLAGFPLEPGLVYNIREYSKTNWNTVVLVKDRPLIENSKFHIKPDLTSSLTDVPKLSTIDIRYVVEDHNSIIPGITHDPEFINRFHQKELDNTIKFCTVVLLIILSGAIFLP